VKTRAARTFRRLILWLVVLALLGTAALVAIGYARRHPEDLPWTELDLTRPVGLFTGRKLAGLRDDPGRCARLLDAAGVSYQALPARTDGAQCGYSDGVRLGTGGSRSLPLRPEEVAVSCPMAAALALFEWHVVQPAAQRHLGRRVAGIDHLGGYSCRRVNGRAEGAWSEHATANAIDIAGFRLQGGGTVSVLRDWSGGGAEAAFLREVRDGACRLFATVLSPDYNEAHRDHLHLDQAQRGARGWRGCR
jgi:hypothetical protein